MSAIPTGLSMNLTLTIAKAVWNISLCPSGNSISSELRSNKIRPRAGQIHKSLLIQPQDVCSFSIFGRYTPRWLPIRGLSGLSDCGFCCFLPRQFAIASRGVAWPSGFHLNDSAPTTVGRRKRRKASAEVVAARNVTGSERGGTGAGAAEAHPSDRFRKRSLTCTASTSDLFRSPLARTRVSCGTTDRSRRSGSASNGSWRT